MLRYQSAGFDQLSLQQKQLAYMKLHLAEEILLTTKEENIISCFVKTLEAAYGSYTGDKFVKKDGKTYVQIMIIIN